MPPRGPTAVPGENAGVLPQLLDRQTYTPCDWNLGRDDAGREYWVDLFCQHLAVLVESIREEYPRVDDAAIDAFGQEYLAAMEEFRRQPRRFERADVLRLTELRRDALNRHGFHDPFAQLKQRENGKALALLPGLLAEVDALPARERLARLAAGLMAGNLFDLGSLPTLDRYRAGQTEFSQALSQLPPRPWRIDDLDAWCRRWQTGPPYRHALFFVDNAGSDIVLGCLPLVRWMLQAGARVSLAANSGPALNDITAGELRGILSQVVAMDGVVREALARGRLAVVPSGSTTPLLDLAHLTPTCVQAARDADLIFLHGMGRAIESNFTATFRCDAVWSAVLKDPAVAARLGAELFDIVLRFRPGAEA